MTRSVSIFGATGSVGLSTLDLIRQHRGDYRVVALTANGNAAAIAQLAREFNAELAVVADESAYTELKDALAGAEFASFRADLEKNLKVEIKVAAPTEPVAPDVKP